VQKPPLLRRLCSSNSVNEQRRGRRQARRRLAKGLGSIAASAAS